MHVATSSLLALWLAQSASTLPVSSRERFGLFSITIPSTKPCGYKHDVPRETAFKGPQCTTVKSPRGGYIFTCPGCTKIVDGNGNVVVKTGDRCDEYDDPNEGQLAEPAFEGPQCTTVRSPMGGYVFHCPGCTRVVDQNGNELVKTGDRCDEYDDPDAEQLESSSTRGQMPLAFDL